MTDAPGTGVGGLADAIQQGLYDWQMSRAPGSGLAEHIAAAVAAWLTSEAVVERAVAATGNHRLDGEIRAALAAATGAP